MYTKKKMKITNKHPYRPDEEFIYRKEKNWRVKLPIEYRKMLLETNGGIPEKRQFMCGKQARLLVRFLCILKDTGCDDYGCYDIDVILTQLEGRIVSDPELVGAEIIPIAELFAGDLACLDYRENKEIPSVCVWFHEESEEYEPVTYKVADSFDEFMDMLFE